MTTATATTANPTKVGATIPAHVPHKLVREFDFKQAMTGVADSYRELDKLHDGPDIFYTPFQGGHWVVTRFDDMEYIFKTAAEFSSHNALIPKDARPMKIIPLEANGSIHLDYRAVLLPFFTPQAVIQLEQQVTDLTVSLIEGFRAKGKCEFMAEFALKLPIGIFMRLVNLPESDVPALLKYADEFFHGETPAIQEGGLAQMVGYVAQKIEQRKGNLGDDLLSHIMQGKVEDGRPMNPDEVLSMASLILLGGLDTVASMLGWIAKFLAQNHDHRRQLVEHPALINKALEEILRRHHIGSLAREVKHDMIYKGITLKAGDMVLLPTVVAGLDEKHYADPFTVDFARADTKHLVFGRGPHACLGALLGRTELRTFVAQWLQRIPDFSITPGTEPTAYITGVTHALITLHLEWKP